MHDATVIAAIAVGGMGLVLLCVLLVAVVMVRVQGMEARAEIQWLHRSLMDAWASWQAANTQRELDAQAHKRRLARREGHIHKLLATISDMGRGLPVSVPPMPMDSVFGEMPRSDEART